MSPSIDSIVETIHPTLDKSDPVFITTLLVELIDAHRRGTVTDAVYEEGFGLLNERLSAPVPVPTSQSDAPLTS